MNVRYVLSRKTLYLLLFLKAVTVTKTGLSEVHHFIQKKLGILLNTSAFRFLFGSLLRIPQAYTVASAASKGPGAYYQVASEGLQLHLPQFKLSPRLNQCSFLHFKV